MFNRELQEREIKTIRERKISVKLSDADCERISELCGEYNISVGELLENFIGDLVNGTYTNGSDERDYAESYVERCFGMYPNKTLLKFLLDSLYYNVEDFCDLLHYIEDGYEELECCKNNPEKFYEIFYKEYIESLKTNNEDWEQELAKELKADMEDWEQEIAEIKSAFLKENKEANWAEEVERVKQWYEELQRLRDWKNN